jgi:phosphoglucomutase
VYEKALRASTTHRHDYITSYVDDLNAVIDMDAVRAAGLKLGVDPLGGAGVHYWPRIAERYRLDLTVANRDVDPTFRFMTLDWDGRIRMDPSSPYAMRQLIDLKDRFDIAFACDTDHDRHGIVTKSVGLLPANHYLAVAVQYLFEHRPSWPQHAAVGKTVVSSQVIDRVATQLAGGSTRYRRASNGSPMDCSMAHSASAAKKAPARRSCGATAAYGPRIKTVSSQRCSPAEITARMGRDPGELYADLVRNMGEPAYERIDAPATPEQKKKLGGISPERVRSTQLAGENIENILSKAPGNGAPIGGLKVVAQCGWFAARPSGTEDIYKIYAESFRGPEHLKRIIDEAQAIVTDALAA